MIKHLRLLLLLLLFARCEEPIELKFDNEPENYLVIDGIITTERKAHQITISRATPFTNNEVTPFNKESVREISISDDQGNSFPLFEVEKGVYLTEDNFAGIEGRCYQLEIRTLNNEIYRSTPQKIPVNGTIDDARFEYEVEPIYNSSADQFVDKKVLKVYADYSFPATNDFIAFDWEGTFFLRVPGSFGRPSQCYVADSNNGIEPILSNVSRSNLSYENQELFSLTYDFRFRDRYSLNVKMFSISEEAFDFLSDVEQQLNTTGSIFDPAPKQIFSNIANISDEDEIVLGFFGAFNVTEKRIFINRSEIPAGETFNICNRGGPGRPPDFCFDCTIYFGASATKPPYWD